MKRVLHVIFVLWTNKEKNLKGIREYLFMFVVFNIEGTNLNYLIGFII